MKPTHSLHNCWKIHKYTVYTIASASNHRSTLHGSTYLVHYKLCFLWSTTTMVYFRSSDSQEFLITQFKPLNVFFISPHFPLFIIILYFDSMNILVLKKVLFSVFILNWMLFQAGRSGNTQFPWLMIKVKTVKLLKSLQTH